MSDQSKLGSQIQSAHWRVGRLDDNDDVDDDDDADGDDDDGGDDDDDYDSISDDRSDNGSGMSSDLCTHRLPAGTYDSRPRALAVKATAPTKSIWQCLLDQDHESLATLFAAYAENSAVELLMQLRVEACPGEFVPRTDFLSLQKEGFGHSDTDRSDQRGQTSDNKWFCFVGSSHGSAQYRTFPAGTTPLHACVRWTENAFFDRMAIEPTSCFHMMLAHGASPHAVDSDGQTVLTALLRGQSTTFLFDDARMTFLALLEGLCVCGSFVSALSKEQVAIANVHLVGFLRLVLLLASDDNLESPLNERLIRNALGAIEILSEHGAVFDTDSVLASLFPDLDSLDDQDRHTIAEWAKQSNMAFELGAACRQGKLDVLRSDMKSLINPTPAQMLSRLPLEQPSRCLRVASTASVCVSEERRTSSTRSISNSSRDSRASQVSQSLSHVRHREHLASGKFVHAIGISSSAGAQQVAAADSAVSLDHLPGTTSVSAVPVFSSVRPSEKGRTRA
jgi:hypothetical protein